MLERIRINEEKQKELIKINQESFLEAYNQTKQTEIVEKPQEEVKIEEPMQEK